MSVKVNVKWNHWLITKARGKKPEESNQSLNYAGTKLKITSGFIQDNQTMEQTLLD